MNVSAFDKTQWLLRSGCPLSRRFLPAYHERLGFAYSISMDYIEDFSLFAERAAEQIAYVQEHPTLKDDPGQDDRLYMTAIPWVSFTSCMHPLDLYPVDSVPRFAWGKFFKDGEFLKMPLSVQAHHALMDGIHMGRFYATVQDYLHHPGFVLGDA